MLRLRRCELLAFLSANPKEAKEAMDIEQKAIAFLARAPGG